MWLLRPAKQRTSLWTNNAEELEHRLRQWKEHKDKPRGQPDKPRELPHCWLGKSQVLEPLTTFKQPQQISCGFQLNCEERKSVKQSILQQLATSYRANGCINILFVIFYNTWQSFIITYIFFPRWFYIYFSTYIDDFFRSYCIICMESLNHVWNRYFLSYGEMLYGETSHTAKCLYKVQKQEHSTF